LELSLLALRELRWRNAGGATGRTRLIGIWVALLPAPRRLLDRRFPSHFGL
jgi:hypothetical protein